MGYVIGRRQFIATIRMTCKTNFISTSCVPLSKTRPVTPSHAAQTI